MPLSEPSLAQRKLAIKSTNSWTSQLSLRLMKNGERKGRFSQFFENNEKVERERTDSLNLCMFDEINKFECFFDVQN